MENELQTQMLVTNQQAYTCAETFGLDLQSQNVTTDIYSLCKIRLSDFSLQGMPGLHLEANHVPMMTIRTSR